MSAPAVMGMPLAVAATVFASVILNVSIVVLLALTFLAMLFLLSRGFGVPVGSRFVLREAGRCEREHRQQCQAGRTL